MRGVEETIGCESSQVKKETPLFKTLPSHMLMIYKVQFMVLKLASMDGVGCDSWVILTKENLPNTKSTTKV